MSTATIVHCDQCAATTDGGTTSHTVRAAQAAAYKVGWEHRGNRDLCPDCQAAGGYRQ